MTLGWAALWLGALAASSCSTVHQVSRDASPKTWKRMDDELRGRPVTIELCEDTTVKADRMRVTQKVTAFRKVGRDDLLQVPTDKVCRMRYVSRWKGFWDGAILGAPALFAGFIVVAAAGENSGLRKTWLLWLGGGALIAGTAGAVGAGIGHETTYDLQEPPSSP